MAKIMSTGELDTLPDCYRILPASIEFRIPHFEKQYRRGDRTLAPAPLMCGEWYETFVDRLVAACGREFLPVCRMSDGEFRFILGEQPPDVRLSWWARSRTRVHQALTRIKSGGAFRAATLPSVSSGEFSLEEWKEAQARYPGLVRTLAARGVLALHLSYGRDNYFQERFFPALGRWLGEHDVILSEQNYVPFYFVYAALTGQRRAELIGGRRILVVHGARGEKRNRIEQRLLAEGASEVAWTEISASRSFYDRIDLGALTTSPEIALVGAGVGKPNILLQLAPLSIPCIDAGYLFEVWADDERKWNRPFCVPDVDISSSGRDAANAGRRDGSGKASDLRR